MGNDRFLHNFLPYFVKGQSEAVIERKCNCELYFMPFKTPKSSTVTRLTRVTVTATNFTSIPLLQELHESVEAPAGFPSSEEDHEADAEEDEDEKSQREDDEENGNGNHDHPR